MEKIVLYKSNYGYSEQYAKWIGEELKCPVEDIKNVNLGSLDSYDTIIYGQGIYAGSFSKINKFKNIIEKYPEKNYIFFCVSVADPEEEANKEYLGERVSNGLGKYNDKVKSFYFRGGLNYEKMSFIHKFMMAMLVRMLKTKAPEDLPEDGQDIINTYGKVVDFSTKDQIEPLISYVENQQ